MRDLVGEAFQTYARFGCGDPELPKLTARWAAARGLSPRLVAAMVIVESECKPYARGKAGEVGLMQVTPRIWLKAYGVRGLNLSVPDDSLRLGTWVLATLAAKHGADAGLRRYNGRGSAARRYARRVMSIAAQGRAR